MSLPILILIIALLTTVIAHLYRLLHYERTKNRYLLRSAMDLQAKVNQYDKLFKATEHRDSCAPLAAGYKSGKTSAPQLQERKVRRL